MSERTLPTLIAELEEALKAATPGPWDNQHGTIRAIVFEGFACPLFESRTPVDLGVGRSFDKRYADAWRQEQENARLIALMRNSLPTLIEAVKRQGEALEKIANPQPHSRNLPSCCQYTFDDTCELFSDIARAAIKEPTDV